MRLRKSHSESKEVLIQMISSGYEILSKIDGLYSQGIKDGDLNLHYKKSYERANTWRSVVSSTLNNIFPLNFESYLFLNEHKLRGPALIRNNGESRWDLLYHGVKGDLLGLKEILDKNLAFYTDLPLQDRIYIEDIDSFVKSRSVNHSQLDEYLTDGRIELSEDFIQQSLEEILNVTFHKKDWGGEINDLYTSNLIINGKRVSTAFLLKGKGLRSKEMQISECGKNGDQIQRLFRSPAELLIVQYVGPISEAVINEVQTHVNAAKQANKVLKYCIIDGQDTAKLLYAYGKI